jgi:hypothetical protein
MDMDLRRILKVLVSQALSHQILQVVFSDPPQNDLKTQ